MSKDVSIVHYPVKNEYLDKKINSLDLDLPTKFNFVTVAQWGPRKNMGATINWFRRIIDNPEVGLVVKTFLRGGNIMDKQSIENELKTHYQNMRIENAKYIYFMVI